MDPELEKALYDVEAAEQYAGKKIQEVEEELRLFDLDDIHSTPQEDTESEHGDIPFYLAPDGIDIFKNDMYSLYTEDDLVWPFEDDTDTFLSVIDERAVKEFIKRGYLMRECSSTNLLVEYVFHTMCCTSDEKLRYSSYNTLMYLLNTCTSFSSIKAQLHMALVNLGADLDNLKMDTSEYDSPVFPDSCDAPQGNVMTRTELRKVLVLVLQFLSVCLASREKHTDQDPDDFILHLIALGLDSKIIDLALDAHIGVCISHCLCWYPSNEHFKQKLKYLVGRILEYCEGDILSVVHLCRAYVVPTYRGNILKRALTFHQLQTHLRLPDEDFVSDIQARHVVHLLSKFYERPKRDKTSCHSYYILTLLDLCINEEFSLQPENRSDILKVCDLVKQEMGHVQFTAEDVYSAIITWYLCHVTLKWKRPASISIQKSETIMKPSWDDTEQTQESVEPQVSDTEQTQESVEPQVSDTEQTQESVEPQVNDIVQNQASVEPPTNDAEQSQESVEPHKNDTDQKEIEHMKRKHSDNMIDNTTEVCDVAPVAPLSPVYPEDFTGFNDREPPQNKKSKLLREAATHLAAQEGCH
ncbi:uncharacterized protein LOC127009017 [Eriocheir sinensis]|uniref:uncharacterized protein LOC127009017 n=1 Tax=Eriocheir sinensis TaxID=95602 RepID=UPI0021C84654|nr:uncharacterized protein LOC127009017 [Eriocheir sinensis]XP_050737558.1 uncharacterized protein LOC127009017 [Eriocheir sinensis]